MTTNARSVATMSPTAKLFPLAVIDFEASSLDQLSYPIEVGIAVARHAVSPVEVWSSLIIPDASWPLDEGWHPDAERVHRIRRAELAGGMSCCAVLERLNRLVPPGATVWCGDDKYDRLWFKRLCDAAASVRSVFQLAGWSSAVGFAPDVRPAVNTILATTPTTHRAGLDAERLCTALLKAVGQLVT